jgi:hypothetical protein
LWHVPAGLLVILYNITWTPPASTSVQVSTRRNSASSFSRLQQPPTHSAVTSEDPKRPKKAWAANHAQGTSREPGIFRHRLQMWRQENFWRVKRRCGAEKNRPWLSLRKPRSSSPENEPFNQEMNLEILL